MFCPKCGKKLMLKEDKRWALFIKTMDCYFAKCLKKHMWQVEVDRDDDNRIVLREIKKHD